MKMSQDEKINLLVSITAEEYHKLHSEYKDDPDMPISLQLLIGAFIHDRHNVATMYLLNYLEQNLDFYRTNEAGLRHRIQLMEKIIEDASKNDPN